MVTPVFDESSTSATNTSRINFFVASRAHHAEIGGITPGSMPPDSRTGADIIDLIHGLHADGTTILVITHDHATAAGMPRQVTLRDGRIVHDAASVAAPAGIGAGLR